MQNSTKENHEILVLIVEYTDSCFYLLSAYLKKARVKFIGVSTGLQAIEICESNKDITHVLLNLRLPDINGIEVCKTIKRMRPMMDVIFQTAIADSESKMLGIQAGASHYLTKPITYKDLSDVLFNEMVEAIQ